jgi:hypothetical protein
MALKFDFVLFPDSGLEDDTHNMFSTTNQYE